MLTSIVKDAPLAESLAGREAGGRDAQFWVQFVGERGPEGGFPFEANLREIALVLQAWSFRYTPATGRVRIRLLSLTPRASCEIQEVCRIRHQRHGDSQGSL